MNPQGQVPEHLVLEHLSGVKGGCPLEEAYYLKLSLFQGVEYFS
jgi:hypothetical protein